MFARRHLSSSLVVRALVVAALVVPLVSGAQCLGTGEPSDDRKRCEAVCDLEGQCEFRTVDECLEALCSADGFIEEQPTDACAESAADCAELAACPCDDGCAAVDTCTGDVDPTCGDTCATLVEQEPEKAYLENRCKITSTCEDLPACTSN